MLALPFPCLSRPASRPAVQRLRRLLAGLLLCLLSTLIATAADETAGGDRGAATLTAARELASLVDRTGHRSVPLVTELYGARLELALEETQAWLLAMLNAQAAALPHWERSARLAERQGLPHLAMAALTSAIDSAQYLGDYTRDLVLIERLRALAEREAANDYRAIAAMYHGVLARRQGQHEMAVAEFERALALAESTRDDCLLSLVLGSSGTVYRDHGDYAKALEQFQRGLDLRREGCGGDRLDPYYRGLALLYRELENAKQARRYFELAAGAAEQRSDLASLATVLGMYASLRNDLGEHEPALAMARRARSLDENLGNPVGTAFERLEAGRALLALGRSEEAATELGVALDMGRRLGQQEVIARAQLHQGELLHARGDRKGAAELLDSAIGLLKNQRLRRPLLAALDARIAVAEAGSEFALALALTRERAALREELLGTEASRRLATLEASIQRAESENQNRLLRKDNEIQSLRLDQVRVTRNALLAAALGLGTALIGLFARYRASRRHSRDLEQKNTEIEHQRAALAQANEKLARQSVDLYQAAITDPLTGVYNRGYMLRQLDERIRAQRTSGNLAVMLIDFDHFKQINDRHGHQFGDRVLAQGVQTIRQWLDPGDLLGRYGGEEFIAVVGEHDLDAAFAIADRLREKVAVAHADPATGGFTVSIGVAALTQLREPSVEAMLAAADKAVYAAKARGRNCTVRYTGPG